MEGTRGSAVNSSISRATKSTDKEKKIGHRRVGEDGEITYKKIQTSTIMGSIQLGIQHTVSDLHVIDVFASTTTKSINMHMVFVKNMLFWIHPTGRKLGLETQTWLADDGLLGNGNYFISAWRIEYNTGTPL